MLTARTATLLNTGQTLKVSKLKTNNVYQVVLTLCVDAQKNVQCEQA